MHDVDGVPCQAAKEDGTVWAEIVSEALSEQPRCIDLFARHKEEQMKILMLVIYNYLHVFLYIFGTGKGLYSLPSPKIVFSFMRCTKQEPCSIFQDVQHTVKCFYVN